MKKKCLLLVVIVLMLFSFQGVFAEVDYTKEADMLNSLGLFNGTDKGYELNRVPTRVEAAAMLVRLLGGEKEANEMKYEHPFTDVPAWANNIIGYMYEKGYTTGIGNNLFGSNQVTIARDYTTFMLRSLGYSSSSDFNYLEALDFATEKGIIASNEADSLKQINFKRNEMVFLSSKTLKASLKDNENLLVDKLFENGTINKSKAFELGLTKRFETVITNIDSSSDKLQVSSVALNINAAKKEIENGSTSGFFVDRKYYYTEGYSGDIVFKKGIEEWMGLKIKYEILFYDKEQFIKKVIYYGSLEYNENDSWTYFRTPSDTFDEIRIIAYPVGVEELALEVEGLYEIIEEKDSKKLKDDILKYGNVSAWGAPGNNVDSIDDITNAVWMGLNYGKTIYNDGSRYKPNAGYTIVDGEFTLKLIDEGSSHGTEGSRKIIGLPRSKDSISLIIIYEKDTFNIAKVYIVK